MRILTFNWHEAYLWLLAKTGHVFDIVLREKGYKGHAAWFHQCRPVPPGARLIEEAEALEGLRADRYDRILCHDPEDLTVTREASVPKVLVLHNRASTILAMNRSRRTREEYLEWFRERLADAGSVRLVYISERKREDWGIPGEVILPGIDLSEYGGYRGDLPRVLRIGNGLRERDLMLGFTEQEEILRGLPSTVLGINPAVPGSRLSKSWHELKSLMRGHRLYLHTTKDPWEDGYNLALLEAMATGMPVVALANRTSPIVDGVNGYVSDNRDYLRDRVRFLLTHSEEARRLGEAARNTVAERFPLERFVTSWNRVLEGKMEVRNQESILTPALSFSRRGRNAIGELHEGNEGPPLPNREREGVRVQERESGASRLTPHASRLTPLKILTFNWHEAYICMLARTGHHFDIVERKKGGIPYWLHAFRPVPENAALVSLEQARAHLDRGAYDAVVCNHLTDLPDVAHCAGIPILLVIHNRLSTMAALAGDGTEPARIRRQLERLLEKMPELALVYVSRFKQEDWGLPGAVIPLAVDPEEYGGYTGEWPRALRVGNHLKERDLMLGFTEQEEILRGLPSTILGINPGIPDARASSSWEDLKDQMQGHRLYLHTTKDPWEDGYNLALLEAMATGMPVVALANRTSPIVDGVNGYVSDNRDYLRDRVRFLLGHPEEARRLGEAARRTAIEQFPLRGFVDAWNRVLEEAMVWKEKQHAECEMRNAEWKNINPQLESPSSELSISSFELTTRNPEPETRNPKRILLAYTANPQTTGAYLDRALRKHHEVVTYGQDIVRFGIPMGDRSVPIWKAWDLEKIKDRVTFPDLPYREEEPDLCRVLRRLPAGWEPDLFLWVDSGNYFSLEGLRDLPCAKAAYFIDSHLALKRHLDMAPAFDTVFVAQRAYLQEFRRIGCREVHWLPLACDPEIHRKHDLPKECDIGFAGTLHPERRRLLDLLGRGFVVRAERCFLEEMAHLYSQSRIVLNQSVRNDLNMRVFEALACGSLLLTDDADGLTEFFTDRRHLVIYRDAEELISLARYYLEHPEEREAIAEAGRVEALAHHTYERRVEEMMQLLASHEKKGVEAEAWDTHPEAAVLQPYCMGKGIDVGCGFRKTHPDAIGIDLLGKGEVGEFGCMKERTSVADIKASGDQLSMFRDGELDYVVNRHNLEHYVDVVKTLKEWKRILKVGGVLGMVLPDESKINTIALDPTHKHAFTPESIKHLLDLIGGFEVEKIEEVVPNWSFAVIARRVAEDVAAGRAVTGRPERNPIARREEMETSYYRQERPELLPLIPETARTILDVGCGEGFLGESLLRRGAAFVAGIERMPAVADKARERLTQVVEGDVETLVLPFAEGMFDCIVCADVLEHLADPWGALKRLSAHLSPDGVLVASVPNARYLGLIGHLADGHWTYQSSGLLDKGHLRFFTLSEIKDLFQRAGLAIAEIRGKPGPLYDQYREQPSQREIRYGRLTLTDLTPEEFQELFIFQYLVQARPANSRQDDGSAGHGVAERRAVVPEGDPIASLCRQGREALAQGNVSAAWKLYDQAVSLNGHTIEPYLGLGAVAIREEAYPEARAWYVQALTLAPGNPRALFGLGLAYWGSGEQESAQQCYEEAAKRDPDNPALLYHLVQAAQSLNRLEDALPPLEAYLRLHPADPDLLYSYAGICASVGRDAEAREARERLRLVARDRSDLNLPDLATKEAVAV